ncbi:semaphorin-1A-like [Oppia nitens]|uniref:semaphorin-1A-like n=1 Tax=Oppia nitens TaxID=1686743 RepID=UPI0023DA4FC7|nr:semaphorin-1A-like [Oppia nitens]
MYSSLIVILLSMTCGLSSGLWTDNQIPKRRISQLKESDVQRFLGNETDSDHFKLLEQDGDSVLVGATNIVYNISLLTLNENKRLQWYSSDDDIKMCKYKGKSDELCQNYIRVLSKRSANGLFVCGTNAFKPKCRQYVENSLEFELVKELSGEGLCPYDPTHLSTATFVDDSLYVATVAGFNGADPLIYRLPLRTEQFNPKHLNAPSFVNSFSHQQNVYFFFRETAVEYMNCGKSIYSRVARVCSNDKGGPHKFRNHWTTFQKARLNCSIPGDFPFYFNEIQSTTSLVKGIYGGHNAQIIYGVFTTPSNSISGSAVCAFKMDDIHKAFDGSFKGQEAIDSNWLPVPSSKVPEPRPGLCVNDSRQLPDMTLNFHKEHTLMDMAVPAFWSSPIVVQTSFKYRFTQIAVDPQIETASGKTFDVLFIATDDGRVIKAINAASGALSGHHYHNTVVPIVIEEVTVFPLGTVITNLLVYHTFYEAKLLVVSNNEIKSIKLFHCLAKTCGECVALQDPYCAFDLARQQCTSSRSRFWNRDNFVQNVEDGWDPRCPDGRPPPTESTKMLSPDPQLPPQYAPDDQNVIDLESTQQTPIYTGESFALAVTTSVITSLVLGFILGYIFSKRCRKEDPNICSPYDDPHQYLDGRLAASETFQTQPPVNNKPINLVLTTNKNSKNLNLSVENKPIQKVKKIYL